MDSAFQQFEGNERLLRTAILSILALVVTYATLTLLAWTSWAWTAGPAEVQNDLPFMVLFEGAIAGLAVAGVSIVHRRRHDLDSLRRQRSAGAPNDPAPTSPLARAEMRAGVLRGMSRQVDSLLLWTPFAIVLTEWTGQTLLTKLAPGAWTSTPLDRTLDLAIVILGVPLAVAIFGVGILLGIRNSTRSQVRLSRGSFDWWNADPSTSGAESVAGRVDESGVGDSRPGGGRPATVAALVRRRRQERSAVLITVAGSVLAMLALAAVGLLAISNRGGPFDCCWGLYSPTSGTVFGLLLAGLLPPAYVGALALRRGQDSRSATVVRNEGASSSSRISDAIAWVAQVETLRGGLREDARDALWLAWFSVAWGLGGLLLLSIFVPDPVQRLGEFFGPAPGPLLPLVVIESLVALVPLAFATFATVAWLGRRWDDLASAEDFQSMLHDYATLEHGFWERF